MNAYDATLRRERLAQPRFFDEIFYLWSNPDVLDVVLRDELSCGLHHFIGWGVFEGRCPNLQWQQQNGGPETPPPHDLDAESYLARHPLVKEFLAEFPQVPWDYFARIFGSRLGHFNELAVAPVPGQESRDTGVQRANRNSVLNRSDRLPWEFKLQFRP